MIKEFLRNGEEDRQSQAELFEREKQEEMQLLSACHSEQFMFRTKDTLRKCQVTNALYTYSYCLNYIFMCDFIVSMEKLLEEELHRTRKLEEHSKYRDYAAQSLLTLLVEHRELFDVINS